MGCCVNTDLMLMYPKKRGGCRILDSCAHIFVMDYKLLSRILGKIIDKLFGRGIIGKEVEFIEATVKHSGELNI